MTIKQNAEAELTTDHHSIRSCSSIRVVNAKVVFLVTHYGLDCTKCIFKERLKEVLTVKAFYSGSVENFKQTKLRIIIAVD